MALVAFFSFIARITAWAHSVCLIILRLSFVSLESRLYEERDCVLVTVVSLVSRRGYGA